MKRFGEFLTERTFWGDSWRGAKNIPPQYQTQEPDPDLDTYRSKAIQALTALRERTQDAQLQDMLEDMVHIIQNHSDKPLGPLGQQQPSQGSQKPWEDDFHRDMEGDQLRLP